MRNFRTIAESSQLIVLFSYEEESLRNPIPLCKHDSCLYSLRRSINHPPKHQTTPQKHTSRLLITTITHTRTTRVFRSVQLYPDFCQSTNFQQRSSNDCNLIFRSVCYRRVSWIIAISSERRIGNRSKHRVTGANEDRVDVEARRPRVFEHVSRRSSIDWGPRYRSIGKNGGRGFSDEPEAAARPKWRKVRVRAVDTDRARDNETDRKRVEG